jgi:putative transposase
MVRIARIVVPGWPHHVTQRGNHRQTVFFNDNDRQVYLELLAKHKRTYHLDLIGFALMGNHAHQIPIPEFEDSLAKGIGRTNNDYSRWLNIRFNQTGHLWQARFYSFPIEPDSLALANVLAYVELNPVRAGFVKRPEDWEWSSARAHLTGVDESGLLNMDWWRSRYTPDTWADFLHQKIHDDALFHRIRTATQTGKPFASEKALRHQELLLHRSLRPQTRRHNRNLPEDTD